MSTLSFGRYQRVVAGAWVLGALVWSGTALAAPLTITKSSKLIFDQPGAIVIKGNNIKLDCNGKKILWAGASNAASCINRYGQSVPCGIKVDGYDGVQIVNCTVWDAHYAIGIWVADSTAPRLLGDRVALATEAGIHLIRTVEAELNSCDVRSSLEGLEMFSASGTSVLLSTFGNNLDAGIDEEWSSDSSFSGNYLVSNYYGYFGWHTQGTTMSLNHVNQNDFMGTTFLHSTLFLVDRDDSGRNGSYGIVVSDYSTRGRITGSTATLNGTCDAHQTGNTSNVVWTGNTFTTRCGKVPPQ